MCEGLTHFHTGGAKCSGIGGAALACVATPKTTPIIRHVAVTGLIISHSIEY